jgi:hypothetical protein
MPAGIAFWVLMIIWLVLGGWNSRTPDGKWNVASFGGIGLQFVLFLLLGWRLFGPPLQ